MMYSFELMLKPANRSIPTPLRAIAIHEYVTSQGASDVGFVVVLIDAKTALIRAANERRLKFLRSLFDRNQFYTGPIENEDFKPRRTRVA